VEPTRTSSQLPTDANGDNVYVVTVLASDGNGLTSSQTVNVTIKDVFEGDYNSDGIVDAADYTVWRDKLGMTVLAFSNPDGSGNGLVDQADYDVWKSNFGNTQPMGSGASEIAPSDPSPTFELPSLAKLETSAEVQSVESVSDEVPVAFTPSIFIVQRDRSRGAHLRLGKRDLPAIAASRDQGLIAWLAARPTAPRHDWPAASCQEFPGELEAGDSSNQFVKKLDQAFSLLGA
jgi:hypothetical protein